MRSLSIQSLMISLTAAFSGLLALRWSIPYTFIPGFKPCTAVLFRMTHRLHMSPSLTNCSFIHDLPCLQVVAHLGILHQLCNCPQGTEHGLQYPDQHSWHAVIFNYKYKKNQIICLSVCKATSCHWSWHCDSCNFPAIINYSKMHQIQYNLTIINLDKFNKPA